MNKQAILDLLVESGLEAYKKSIEPLLFPSFQMHLQPDEDDNIPIGASKLGGSPDLPDHVPWPEWHGYKQSFIAQIRLDELGSAGSPLPASGLLSFFYPLQAMYEDEAFYGSPDTCRIIYTDEQQLGKLRRRPSPGELTPDALMKPNRISYAARLCAPAAESAYLNNLGLGWDWMDTRDDFEKYWNVFEVRFRKLWQPDSYIHRLLGHPDPIQGDMQVGCEVMNRGISYDELQDPQVNARVQQSALQWRLLLQIDSEEEKTGVMFGDVGRIYFWIREEDLAAGRFDKVICEMQCC